MARAQTGIYRRGDGWIVYVRVRGRLYTKTYPGDTAPAVMRAWREAQRTAHGAAAAPAGGSFAAAIDRYCALHATMPTITQRAQHLALWARALGRDRASDSITADEVIAVLNQWTTTPTVIPKGARGRPSAPTGLSPATRRKRRTALQSFFAALNGKGGYNPVRAVPIPSSPPPEARHLDYATIERVIACMPTTRTGTRAAPRGVSLARVRVRVLAHTGLPPGMLKQIGPTDLDLVAPGVVRVRARAKGAGVEARTIPLTAGALAAFQAFHAANAYGRFATSALNTSFQRACARAGLKPRTVTLYDLRHSFLTKLYETTRDLATVARFGLHANGSRVTARYAQGANRAVDFAAAAAMSADLAAGQRAALKLAIPIAPAEADRIAAAG